MGIKIAAIGAFLTIIGSITIALSLTTDAAVFQPLAPPLLALVVGGLLLVVGLILP